MKNWWFFGTRNKACTEGYIYFDRHIRLLPKNPDGSIKETAEFHDNDIDAFRHAYVSGVMTQEYGEAAADILGQLNEIFSFAYNSSGGNKSRNMDLWNNAVGRRYGLKTRKRKTLARALHRALKRGELIISLNDPRKFGASQEVDFDSKKPVIVLKESKTGRNERFYDLASKEPMTRSEFVSKIRGGQYPGYKTIRMYGKATPFSRPDGSVSNNLN